MNQLNSVSRRQLLLGGGIALSGALGATLLSGCGGSAQAASESQLRFWHLLSGGDGIKMQAMIDTANASQQSFHVNPTVLAWGAPYYTKLAMASAGGRPPEVAIMHASRVTGYAPGGLLDPWDVDLLAKNGVTKDDFSPRIWENSLQGGKLYSIALDSHPFILMYNTEVAQKAGALAADGQLEIVTSPDRFKEMALEMAKVTGKHGLSYGYLSDGAQMWRLFYTFYKQHGASMELVQGQKAVVDRDVAIGVLEYIHSLLDDKIATASGDGGTAIAEFAAQDSGMLMSGVWELPTMQTAKVPFDAMPIPTLFGTPAAYADSHAFVLPHQLNLDEQKRNDVYAFVADILKGSLNWAKAGHIPGFQPVVQSAEFKNLLPQAHYAGAAEIINYDPRAWFTGSGSDFQSFFAENVQNVFLGRTKAKDGWDAFVERLDTLLSKPNPV
ncbi:extracellular solute-binding protein [Arthrobacter glacialis]|uniref:Carbohydrate-binding protein n=1 Tax=Arthrobacter glacialis TaxID=1664 RepID=A0A2S3ZTS3_ARTGL|nr:extracellular solute-binding protein [Arthrobacter glacialis]POH57871.1 carbohydrate-binding protein [Arthrobacter glacialis]POH72671.1 carbohydrate-binding protein [Arthrobacter glacialis]